MHLRRRMQRRARRSRTPSITWKRYPSSLESHHSSRKNHPAKNAVRRPERDLLDAGYGTRPQVDSDREPSRNGAPDLLGTKRRARASTLQHLYLQAKTCRHPQHLHHPHTPHVATRIHPAQAIGANAPPKSDSSRLGAIIRLRNIGLMEPHRLRQGHPPSSSSPSNHLPSLKVSLTSPHLPIDPDEAGILPASRPPLPWSHSRGWLVGRVKAGYNARARAQAVDPSFLMQTSFTDCQQSIGKQVAPMSETQSASKGIHINFQSPKSSCTKDITGLFLRSTGMPISIKYPVLTNAIARNN